MKTLFVLRHAKSSWDFPHLSDFERPLNKRGEKAAPLMGKVMREREFVPEIILSSPAMRAKTTANLVKESAECSAEIILNRSIYESGTNNLLYIISEISDAYESVMIVGHNPTFEGIVQILSGEYQRMPTAALAIIDLNIESWSDTKPNCGNLREVLIPKDFQD